jgi:hypothetical protein
VKSLRILTVLLALGGFVLVPVSAALAAVPAESGGQATCRDEGEVKVGVAVESGDKCVGDEDNAIIEYSKGIIKFLSGAVGLVVVLMLVISGVQYVTSQGNSDQVKNAKNRLTNAVVGLILFIMMYGILEVLIPGRIFE